MSHNNAHALGGGRPVAGICVCVCVCDFGCPAFRTYAHTHTQFNVENQFVRVVPAQSQSRSPGIVCRNVSTGVCVQSVELRCHPVADDGGGSGGGDILSFVCVALTLHLHRHRRAAVDTRMRNNIAPGRPEPDKSRPQQCRRITSFIWATHNNANTQTYA